MKEFLNMLWKGFLWVVDFFVSLYFLRWTSRRRRGEPPFQKATKEEWRYGCFFVAIFPAFMVIASAICKKIPSSVANSFFSSGYAGILLWLVFVVFVSVGVFTLIKVTPKIPLSVSIPMAAITWPICAWYFIAQFHATWSHK